MERSEYESLVTDTFSPEKPLIAIIMGSDSDLPVMRGNALSQKQSKPTPSHELSSRLEKLGPDSLQVGRVSGCLFGAVILPCVIALVLEKSKKQSRLLAIETHCPEKSVVWGSYREKGLGRRVDTLCGGASQFNFHGQRREETPPLMVHRYKMSFAESMRYMHDRPTCPHPPVSHHWPSFINSRGRRGAAVGMDLLQQRKRDRLRMASLRSPEPELEGG